MNAHSDTNTNDVMARKNTETKDQKQIIYDTLPYSRQETIRSYTILSTNDNQVDRQYDREYDSICKQDYNEKHDRYRLEQKQT